MGKGFKAPAAPATVSEDETCHNHWSTFSGKGQEVDRNASQETSLFKYV